MQWSLFLLILMGSFLTCQLYEYHFIEKQKTWDDARKYCREKYTDLATVYDMTDVRRLLNSRKDQQEAWIGLYNQSLPGVEYDATETKWCHGQLRVERCFRILDCIIRLYWSPTPCTEKHGFICYDGKKPHKKFHLIKKTKTWPEAQSYCREKHTDLVSGLNQLEDEELIRKIKNSHLGIYWVGMFRDNWRWSDGSPSSFRHWDHNYFDNQSVEKKCAVTMLDETGRWQTGNCDDKKSFFCYDDKVILINENKTWEEALYYCREKYRDLVSITNPDEQSWVEKRAKIADSPFVWLGLRYTCTLDFWFWVSDEVVSYKNWASPGQKDECDMSGAMDRGGQHQWIRHLDNEKFNFICSKF
ncbi:macrophage mannose receptor 1-like [Thunnus maccoyii]|uniref:macrophage mannose receptor 1-like n=1 Tax=Thunnus maccoyii TaxID=8240 RepID=UPI001C4BC9FA|nr:macrophage mannose receptor 1-like [Thunnus maccoyii]